MNVTRFFLLWSFLSASLNCFAQAPVWSQFPNSPAGTTRHDDICFVSETHGWTARGRDGIHRTTDGGNTWLKVLTNSSTHFRSIGFASATVGFAGNLGPGSYDALVTDTNLLYRTDDGGDTWTVVPGINESGMKGFCALHVLDSQHIFGGGRVRGPAHFVKSADGGNTWTVVDLTSMGVMGGIMDIYFKDPLNGFVVGMDTNAYAVSCGGPYYGRIAKTTDGGVTWTTVTTTPVSCSYFWKMSWPSPEVGYVSLQQNGTRNRVIVYKTIDGGDTWFPLEALYSAIGVGSYFTQSVGFINENEGWMGGDSATSPYLNNFLHTTNGGTNWTPVGYNDSRAINKIRIYPNFAVASGGKLHVYRVPLSIASHPQDQTNVIGASVTFSVTAYGAAPISYQWRFNGTNIFGATTNSFTIPSVQSAHAGTYDVIVSDISGSLISSPALLTLEGVVISPTIIVQPQHRTVGLGATTTFSVMANGSNPLAYQWFFNDNNLAGETAAILVRTNVQPADAGSYSVSVSNSAGTVVSDIAPLTVMPENAFFFQDNFDGFNPASEVTGIGITNGYKILFSAASGPQDFRAIFGFDYAAITFPISIPSAPHSTDGSTRGLLLRVNKDATGSAAAVNLYPLGVFASNHFSLRFDMWINWTNIGSGSEHALFGINHSSDVANRVLQTTSDGLFFAANSDGNVSGTATTIRDYSVFRGGGPNVAPILMLPGNSVFGPIAPLGAQFDSANSGFANLFPAKPIPGYPMTPAGSPGLRWVSAEVRQESQLVSWLLNGMLVAQYTNNFTNGVSYTNGTVMIGFNDVFDSVGSTNNFVIFDNVQVERIFPTPVAIASPRISANQFRFAFATDVAATYTVRRTAVLNAPAWNTYTNIIGDGTMREVLVPLLSLEEGQYFQVTRP